MELSVTPACVEFSEQISQLTAELGYQVNVENTAAWLNVLIDSPLHAVFVVQNAEQDICGWIVVEKRLILESGFSAEITGLVVGAAFRRQGVAKLLVDAAENWAHEQQLNRLVVRSNAKRVESHLFYPSIGFEHTKTSEVYVKRFAS
ncbi:MAG: GNAT family N-acetyltransferase [Vibrio sp.]